MVACPSCGATVDQAALHTQAVAPPSEAASPLPGLDDRTEARPSPTRSAPVTTAAEPIGRCPSCDAPGAIGTPCPERVCALRAVHRIPEEHAAKVRADHGSSDPLVGQVIAGYLVVDLLGQGGFGKVLLALQQPTYRLRAALKLFSPASPDERTTRSLLDKFQNEAATLAVLEHPNIVRLLGHGTHGDRPWIAMEFVGNARTLEADLRHRMRASAARDILAQLLNALEAAHAAGIVHRDIKPENVMLQTVVGSDHFVRLVDFGIAKTLDAGRKTSLVLGTPYYMAPEQLGGTDVGPFTDLYAVGVIAFELLTGKHLYGDLTSEEVLRRKIDPRFDPLALVSEADLAAPLRSVLARALCRDPAERYASAAVMRQELEAALSGAPAGDAAAELRAERAALEAERRAMEDERRRFADSHRPPTPAPPPALPPPPPPVVVAAAGPKKKGAGLTVVIVLVALAAAAGGTVWAVKHFKSDPPTDSVSAPKKGSKKSGKKSGTDPGPPPLGPRDDGEEPTVDDNVSPGALVAGQAEDFAQRICDCEDAACVRRIQEEVSAWGLAMQNSGVQVPPAYAERLQAADIKASACAAKLGDTGMPSEDPPEPE